MSKSVPSPEIANRIKDIRNALGLSQAEFALKIGRDRSTIANVEGAINGLSKSTRTAICNTFDVRDEWILTGKGEMFGRRGGLIIDLCQNTGMAVEYILKMLPQIKTCVEIHYRDNLREKAVNHIIEMGDDSIQFVYSPLNMDRRPRQLEIEEIRSAFSTSEGKLLFYKTTAAAILDIVENPKLETLKQILQSAVIDDSTMQTSTVSGFPASLADPPRHPVAAFMPTPDIISHGIDPALQAMSDIKDIFDSGDPILIPAIQANLSAFKRALQRERQFAQVIKENEDLKNRISKLESLCLEIPNLKIQIETLQSEHKVLRTENNRLKATYEGPDGTDGRITNTSDQVM